MTTAAGSLCRVGVLLVAAAMPAGARAETIYVNLAATGAGDGSTWADAFTTVPAALDAADRGDQVWVAAGRYVGIITLKDGVALYGGFAGTESPLAFDLDDRDFRMHETVLQGHPSDSVVTSPAGATATTRLDGFTITGGHTYQGGGVHVARGSPTITHNRIVGNRATNGGGICAEASNAVIAHNVLTGNEASNCGGAIYVHMGDVQIRDNTVHDNTAWRGAGIGLWYSASTIAGNVVSGNLGSHSGGIEVQGSTTHLHDNILSGNAGGGLTLTGSGALAEFNVITGNIGDQGGGVTVYDGAPIIRNNTITDNDAPTLGGGGVLLIRTAALVQYNTIADNRAIRGGGVFMFIKPATIDSNAIMGNTAIAEGGGIFVGYTVDPGTPRVVNNVLTRNQAAGGGGSVFVGTDATPAAIVIGNNIFAFNSPGLFASIPTVVLTHNCAFQNGAYDYSGVADPSGINGNVSADPGFIEAPDPGPDGVWATPDDEVGDLHLLAGSPCLDAGSNGLVAGDVDLEGRPRIADGDSDGGAVADMGAYESRTAGPGDFDGDGDLDLADYARLLDAFGSCAPEATFYAPADFDHDGCITFPDTQYWISFYRAHVGNAQAPPPARLGDLDGDLRLDAQDVQSFAHCLTGPDGAAPPDCAAGELDGDVDVDLADYALLQQLYAGER